MARNQAEKQLFDLLVTRDFDPQTLDAQGKPAPTPEDARLFSFDYRGESGKDYGTVVIMLDDANGMTVFTGDNTGKSMEGEDKRAWFDFQAQLKRFAMQNLMTFNLQNLNKLKYSMQGQAALAEGLFESWQGRKDVSYNADATQARLMIKHKRNIGEGEARFRNIQALFIETADGERFKLPFTKLSGGRAMLEHVRQGGRPYDMRGAHIATIVNEMNLLARFKRANQNRIFEGEVANLVEQANNYYATLQHSLKSLGSKTGYKKYFESWNPAEITDEDVIIEDLRHMFVEQNIDARVEQALPLLAKLQQESAMKEINVFEGWMNLLSEGTWALPDSKEKQQQLVSLLSQELPVGPDATNATEQLYDILGDDELFDRLGALAEQDANADARTVILERLEEMKDNPSVAQVIGKLKIESNPAEQPVQESINSYDVDNTPCPACYEKELTYLQGTNHVKCGACGKGFSLAGKEEMDEMGGMGAQKVFHKGQWLPASQVPKDELMAVREGESCHVCHKAKPVCECSLEEAEDTVEKDPATGKTKSWKHEGDWERVKKVNGKPVNPRGEVTHMSDKARRETEKLDELDKDTLGSYIKKAASDRAMRNFDQGVDTGSTFQDREPKFDWHNNRKDDQRRAGISKAVSRLTKEGDMEEAYDSPLDTPAAQAARNHLAKAMAPVKQQHPDHPALKNFKTDETVGGGNWLEEGNQVYDPITKKMVAKKSAKVKMGGGWRNTDPETGRVKDSSDPSEIGKHKDELEEATVLKGKYGHSGKLEAVKGTDADMMDRIKFLAGVTK